MMKWMEANLSDVDGVILRSGLDGQEKERRLPRDAVQFGARARVTSVTSVTDIPEEERKR